MVSRSGSTMEIYYVLLFTLFKLLTFCSALTTHKLYTTSDCKNISLHMTLGPLLKRTCQQKPAVLQTALHAEQKLFLISIHISMENYFMISPVLRKF